MFKNTLKCFLFPALLLVLVVSFVTPNSVQAAITGNNSPETAKLMGYWKYGTPDTTILPADENEAYYQSSPISTMATTRVEQPIDRLITPINLSNEEKERLVQLGFTENEIATMSLEEYNKYRDLDGELLSLEESYYKIVSDSQGNVLKTVEVSEDATLTALDQSTPTFRATASDTEETSWMKMTTTSSKLSNGNIQLKNSFIWLNNPQVALTDVVAISHSANAVKVPDTEGFSYKYTDGKGTHSVSASGTTRNDYGIAKKFNLKAIGINSPPTNHNGYISVQVKKSNQNDIRANAYGHYTHVTIGFTSTIDIKSGSISVGGTISESKMTDTMILFDY